MVNKSKVLIIGSIGREHALGWKLKQSPKVEKIYFAPGNPGTEPIGESTGIDGLDVKGLLKFALEQKIDFTIAGSDDVLALGVVNEFKEQGLKIFGPTKEAAQIEWSKGFAKQLMKAEGIPTAKFETFTDASAAKKYINQQGAPIVIKASGLALGKGVTVARTIDEALLAIDEIMVKKIFGDAGTEVVVEEFMEGLEISIHAFSDGKTFSLFPTSRDHKPIFDGNKGPNTGGMGTISPISTVTQEEMEIIKKEIVERALNGLKKSGTPFTGCLYPGLMMTADGPKVVEFNSRFGDPEMESYMRLLKTDVFDILLACAEGRLSEIEIEWNDQFACCIVLASGGYPGDYKKGVEIFGLDTIKDSDVVVFHFATKKQDGKVVTNGGRVLGVTAVGATLDEALKKAYLSIGDKGINFEGMQYRKDIGKIL